MESELDWNLATTRETYIKTTGLENEMANNKASCFVPS